MPQSFLTEKYYLPAFATRKDQTKIKLRRKWHQFKTQIYQNWSHTINIIQMEINTVFLKSNEKKHNTFKWYITKVIEERKSYPNKYIQNYDQTISGV